LSNAVFVEVDKAKNQLLNVFLFFSILPVFKNNLVATHFPGLDEDIFQQAVGFQLLQEFMAE